MTAPRSRLRVAVDATPLLGTLTGIGVFTDEVLTRLAADDTVALTAYATSWRGRDRLRQVVPPGVHAASRPMAARPLRELWRRTDHPVLEWWTGPVDIAHGTNFVVPPTRGAVELASVHDLTPVRFPELCTADTRQYPDLIRRALRRGAHLQTGSAFVAAELRAHFGLGPDRVTVVEYGISPIPQVDPALGVELAGVDRYVLALGTAEPRKDLPLLVRAFDDVAAEDPDIGLVLAGADGWGTEDLQRAIAGSAHGSRIHRLARFVSEKERAALLRGATVLAYPSRYEGFGLPPLEAMSVGTPVVATTAGSLPEVLDDGALLTPVGDSDALAHALRRVLTDSALARDLAERGRRRAERYSWDDTAAAILELYERLAVEASSRLGRPRYGRTP